MDFDFNDHVYMVANAQYSTHYTVQQSSNHNSESTKIEHEIRKLLKILPQRSDLLVEKLTSEPIHVQHAEKILKQAKHVGYVSQDLLTLMIKILEYTIGGNRNFEEGKIIINEIDGFINSSKINLKSYDKAMLLIDKGFFEAAHRTNYALSAELTKQGLNILNQSEKLYEEKLRAVINLYQDYILRGMKDEAEYWLKKAADLFKLSKSPSYNCLYLNVYTYYLISQNSCKEALNYINDAKKYSHKARNYPSMEIGILSQEIEILLRLGRFTDALIGIKNFQNKISTCFQNRENLYTIRNLLYQGWIALETERNYDQAIKDINKSIEMADRLFQGPDMHILQPLQHTVLGRALEGQQKYAQALVEYQFAERTYKKILEQLNGMDDVSVLYQHLMQISLKLNQLEQAQQYLQTHIDLFGPEHPRSKEMQKMLTVSHY